MHPRPYLSRRARTPGGCDPHPEDLIGREIAEENEDRLGVVDRVAEIVVRSAGEVGTVNLLFQVTRTGLDLDSYQPAGLLTVISPLDEKLDLSLDDDVRADLWPKDVPELADLSVDHFDPEILGSRGLQDGREEHVG